MFSLIDNHKTCPQNLIEEWRVLNQNALVPNPFFGPDFLLPALSHLEKKPVQLALLRDKNNRLIALAPIIKKRLFKLGPSYISLWNHGYMPLTCPLISKQHPLAFEELVHALITEFRAPLIIEELKGFSAFFDNNSSLFKSLLLKSYKRAALSTASTGHEYRQKNLSTKTLQGLNRRYRRLAEKVKALGPLTIEFWNEPPLILERFEDFMTLEKLGWKGKNKTSILSNKTHATFAREAILNLSKNHFVTIAMLIAGKTPLAALTLFKVDNHYYSWKTSFNETYKNYSPGVQLLARFSDALLEKEAIILDSCASPNNDIANKIWSERVTIEKRLFYLSTQKTKAHLIKYHENWKDGLIGKIKAFIKGARLS